MSSTTATTSPSCTSTIRVSSTSTGSTDSTRPPITPGVHHHRRRGRLARPVRRRWAAGHTDRGHAMGHARVHPDRPQWQPHPGRPEHIRPRCRDDQDRCRRRRRRTAATGLLVLRRPHCRGQPAPTPSSSGSRRVLPVRRLARQAEAEIERMTRHAPPGPWWRRCSTAPGSAAADRLMEITCATVVAGWTRRHVAGCDQHPDCCCGELPTRRARLVAHPRSTPNALMGAGATARTRTKRSHTRCLSKTGNNPAGRVLDRRDSAATELRRARFGRWRLAEPARNGRYGWASAVGAGLERCRR